MLTFKDGTRVNTPRFASATGTRTSYPNTLIRAGGLYVASDWTRKSATILGVVPIVAVCTDRPADKLGYTRRSVAAPLGWTSI